MAGALRTAITATQILFQTPSTTAARKNARSSPAIFDLEGEASPRAGIPGVLLTQ